MVRLTAVVMLVACTHGAKPRPQPTRVIADEAGPAVDVSSCCGAEPASLGSLFRGITLGQTTRPTLPPDEGLGPDILFDLEMPGERLEAVAMSISDVGRKPPVCPILRDNLVRAWGPSIDARWESRARDQAAELTTLSPPSCELRFYRLVPAEKWLNATRDSVVPIWALGRPITQLEAALAPLHPEQQDPKFYPPSIQWHDLTIDGEELELTAYHAHGRVIGIEIGLIGDRDLHAWHRLVAVFGPPGPCDVQTDNQRWTWTRAPGIVLDNWVGDLPTPAPGQPIGTQDMHPAEPNGLHTSIVFGVKPPYP